MYADSARSEPVTEAPEPGAISARPLIPAPPIPTKCSRRPGRVRDLTGSPGRVEVDVFGIVDHRMPRGDAILEPPERSGAVTRPFACLSGPVAAVAVLAAALTLAAGSSHARRSATRDHEAAVRGPVSGPAQPGNPLMLAAPPGSDPLNGAAFFVNGPAHGAAAGAIARLIGIDTSTSRSATASRLPGTRSAGPRSPPSPQALPQFRSRTRPRSRCSRRSPPSRRSSGSARSRGGGPGAALQPDPEALLPQLQGRPRRVPIVNTYFLHADLGGCPTTAQILADRPAFERRVNELAQGIGNRPVVLLLETDAIGSTSAWSSSNR